MPLTEHGHSKKVFPELIYAEGLPMGSVFIEQQGLAVVVLEAVCPRMRLLISLVTISKLIVQLGLKNCSEEPFKVQGRMNKF